MSANAAAPLTSALLVRKGAATPAGYVALGGRASRLPASALPRDASPGERAKGRRRATAPDTRTRISLRLDAERHLKLKLSAAHLHQSLQDLLITALDAYLEQVGPAVMNGNCACLDGGCATPGTGCEQR